MSEAYDSFRWTDEDIDMSISDEDGYLPTAEMVKRMGFSLRVRNVPAPLVNQFLETDGAEARSRLRVPGTYALTTQTHR